MSALYFEPSAAGPQPRSEGMHRFRLNFPKEGILASKQVEFVSRDGVDALQLISEEGRARPVELWRDERLLCVIARSDRGLFQLI